MIKLKRENRPFKNWKTFYKKVIKLWNHQAKKGDIIYCIGDFVDYVPCRQNNCIYCLKLAKKINAKVILIIGNNEERFIRDCFENDFDKFRDFCINVGFYDVKKEEYLEIDGISFYLIHRPCNHKNNYLNLFGHTHRATGLWKPYGINVGCDLNHFRLYDLKEIKRLLSLKEKYWDNDEDNLSM